MNIEKSYDLKEVSGNLCFEGSFLKAEPYGFGHINDTFALYFKEPDGSIRRYIIQRINHNIFKDPEKLMENIKGVTEHLGRKINSEGGDVKRETLNLIPANDGKCYYRSPEGDYWRGYIFIEGAKTYQVVENASHLYNAGIAFGRFQTLLSDFQAEKLHETIPDFHNTKKRFEAFIRALKSDVMNRAKDVREEIEFVLRHKTDTEHLLNLLSEKRLPLRVTHNDTKFNNVMIDDITGEGICVIDLDTVMPGLSLYDFGDSIRSGTNTAEEDERDISKVNMDLDLFESFTEGFLGTAGGFLTELEIELLPFSAKIMTLECGIRFLSDHLCGDTYFKIHREDHNLDRARTQFKLVRDMEEKWDYMKQIVGKCKSVGIK